MNNNYIGQKIESPLYSFNNVIYKIINSFEKELKIKNLGECLFFNEKTINLFGWIEIKDIKGVISVNIMKELNYKDLNIVNLIYQKYDFICSQFALYIMMYNKIAKNCDEVPQVMVDNIIKDVKTNSFIDKSYLLPFKDKLSELDKELNIYEKYELFLSFHKRPDSQDIIARIKKCMSTTLNESKSINNLKYYDLDTIHEVVVDRYNVEEFITKLYYYGEV